MGGIAAAMRPFVNHCAGDSTREVQRVIRTNYGLADDRQPAVPSQPMERRRAGVLSIARNAWIIALTSFKCATYCTQLATLTDAAPEIYVNDFSESFVAEHLELPPNDASERSIVACKVRVLTSITVGFDFE